LSPVFHTEAASWQLVQERLAPPQVFCGGGRADCCRRRRAAEAWRRREVSSCLNPSRRRPRANVFSRGPNDARRQQLSALAFDNPGLKYRRFRTTKSGREAEGILV
jgi:hypothetical protein